MLFRSDEEVIAGINTTPLVDVMLVLLIIFLITVPVVTTSVPVTLPKERVEVRESKPENIVISVDKGGTIHWFDAPVRDTEALVERLTAVRGIERYQTTTRGEEDAGSGGAHTRPIAKTTLRRRTIGHVVLPDFAPGLRRKRDDTRRRRYVHHASNDNRRELGASGEATTVIRPPHFVRPGLAQTRDVGGGDLGERRVPRPHQIAVVHRPFGSPGRRRRLLRRECRQQYGSDQDEDATYPSHAPEYNELIVAGGSWAW